MLKIKLSRYGKKNQPHFRIVVNEAKDKRDGSYVEKIGHYFSNQTPKVLELDLERYNFWIGQGAQPTPTVAYLAKIEKSGKGFPAKSKKKSKKQTAKKAEVKQEKSKEKQEKTVETQQVAEKEEPKPKSKSGPKADKKIESKPDPKQQEKKADSKDKTKTQQPAAGKKKK